MKNLEMRSSIPCLDLKKHCLKPGKGHFLVYFNKSNDLTPFLELLSEIKPPLKNWPLILPASYIFSTILELFILSCFVFNLCKKLSIFKFFSKNSQFFSKKSQTFNNYHVRILIYLSLVDWHISFFYLKKKKSFIGL